MPQKALAAQTLVLSAHLLQNVSQRLHYPRIGRLRATRRPSLHRMREMQADHASSAARRTYDRRGRARRRLRHAKSTGHARHRADDSRLYELQNRGESGGSLRRLRSILMSQLCVGASVHALLRESQSGQIRRDPPRLRPESAQNERGDGVEWRLARQ